MATGSKPRTTSPIGTTRSRRRSRRASRNSRRREVGERPGFGIGDSGFGTARAFRTTNNPLDESRIPNLQSRRASVASEEYGRRKRNQNQDQERRQHAQGDARARDG